MKSCCCGDVSPRLDEEGREDWVPEGVNVECLVIGFEKCLQARHGMGLDLRISVLSLVGGLLRVV